MAVIQILFLSLSLSLASASISETTLMHENVFFHKVGTFSMSRSRWLVSFVIDLGTYERYLDKLSNDIQKASKVAMVLIHYHLDKMKPNDRRDYSTVFQSLKGEIGVIMDIHNDIKSNFNEYKLLQHPNNRLRFKRRFLGFVGDLMNTLFGTLTEADISSIQRNVRNLAANQLDLSHALTESISVINMSRIDIRENRQKINDVIRTLKDVDDRISNVSEILESRINDVEQFVLVSKRFDLVVDEIKIALTRSMYFYLNLQIQIQSITRHSLSPSTIPAQYFREILLTVQEQLPQTVGLPLDPRKHLFEYYQNLNCVPMFDSQDRIIITTQIPLVEYTQRFDIFKAHSLPVPLLGTTQNDKKELLATYRLESDYLAISLDRSKYVLLPDQVTSPCSDPAFNICNIKEPIRNTNVDQSCILANFNQDKYKVNKYCDVWIQHNVLPTALYLSNDVYLIITKTPLVFHMTCKDDRPRENRLSVKEPFGFVTVRKQCKAISHNFELVGYYENYTKKSVEDPAAQLLKEYNFSDFRVWDKIKKLDLFRNNSLSVPDELTELKEFPLSTLVDKISKLRPMENMTSKVFPAWEYFVIAAGIIIIAIVVLCLYCKYRNFNALNLLKPVRNDNAKRNRNVLSRRLKNVEASRGSGVQDDAMVMSVLLQKGKKDDDGHETIEEATASETGHYNLVQRLPVLDTVKRGATVP